MERESRLEQSVPSMKIRKKIQQTKANSVKLDDVATHVLRVMESIRR